MPARDCRRSRLAALLLASVFAFGWVDAAARITPLAVKETPTVNFPAALSFSALTEGVARVLVEVDAAGELIDLLPVEYTHPAFADEAVSVLRRSRYQPATEDGHPVPVRTLLTLNFQAPRRVLTFSPVDTVDLLVNNRTSRAPGVVTKLVHPRELDRPLAVRAALAPGNPVAGTSPSEGSEKVRVDFYVDERGAPRMPAVVAASDEACAAVALAALTQWRFEPPTRAGEAVVVRVQQEFVFPRALAPASAR